MSMNFIKYFTFFFFSSLKGNPSLFFLKKKKSVVIGPYLVVEAYIHNPWRAKVYFGCVLPLCRTWFSSEKYKPACSSQEAQKRYMALQKGCAISRKRGKMKSAVVSVTHPCWDFTECTLFLSTITGCASHSQTFPATSRLFISRMFTP